MVRRALFRAPNSDELFSARRLAPSLNGTTSISTDRWRRSSASNSSAGQSNGGQFIVALLAFAAGFAVRPFGALVFGRVGDLVGRKYTFHRSRSSSWACRPSRGRIADLRRGRHVGAGHPRCFTSAARLGARRRIWRRSNLCRGARADGKARRLHGWIQTTATVGLLLSLVLILGCRSYMW